MLVQKCLDTFFFRCHYFHRLCTISFFNWRLQVLVMEDLKQTWKLEAVHLDFAKPEAYLWEQCDKKVGTACQKKQRKQQDTHEGGDGSAVCLLSTRVSLLPVCLVCAVSSDNFFSWQLGQAFLCSPSVLWRTKTRWHKKLTLSSLILLWGAVLSEETVWHSAEIYAQKIVAVGPKFLCLLLSWSELTQTCPQSTFEDRNT